MILWFVFSFLAIYTAFFAYSVSIALVGLLLGAKVRQVSVGVIRVFAWQGAYWRWKIGILPMTAGASFGQDQSDHGSTVDTQIESEKAGQLDGLPEAAWRKLCITCAGPLSNIILGLLLVCVSPIVASKQMVLTDSEVTEVKPVSVGGLAFVDEVPTLASQLSLIQEVFYQALSRFVFFDSIDGWGGPIGFIITAASIGQISLTGWLTWIGLGHVLLGLLNLLPIPSLNGGFIVQLLFIKTNDSDNAQRNQALLYFAGWIFTIVIMFRMLYADFVWLNS